MSTKKDFKKKQQRWGGEEREGDFFLLLKEVFIFTGKPAAFLPCNVTDPDWSPSLNLGHSDVKPTNTARSDRANLLNEKRKEAQNNTENDPPAAKSKVMLCEFTLDLLDKCMFRYFAL